LDQLSVTKHLSNSVEWKLRDKVEWSVDVESEFFIQTLSLSLSLLVKIEDLPSLVGSILLVVNTNDLSFLILVSYNFNTSVGLLNVAEVFSLVDKDLEPS
jgi:hypothetical protein